MSEKDLDPAAPPTPSAARPTTLLTRLLFLRLLGSIYFIAFLGLIKQLRPLHRSRRPLAPDRLPHPGRR